MKAIGLVAVVSLAPLGLGLVSGCGGDDDGGDDDVSLDAGELDAGVEPLFPADYASRYTEVRGCRKSGDHDLNFIRVLVDAAALGPYQDRATPFPDGAVVLKEEYDFADATCTDGISRWTVMVKDASKADFLGWSWQTVDTDRTVSAPDAPRCYGCHAGCADQGFGYDGTCTDP